MWKKAFVICLALVGTFSVVYAMNHEMSANASVYAAGGEATGRINKAPSNLSLKANATNIGIQKGDKILTGIKNPMNNEELGFQLLRYNDYDTTTVNCQKSDGTSTACDFSDKSLTYQFVAGSKKSAWYSMATDFIGKVEPISVFPSNWDDEKTYVGTGWGHMFYDSYGWHFVRGSFKTSNYKPLFDDINAKLTNSSIMTMIEDRDLDYLSTFTSARCTAVTHACPLSKAYSKEYVESIGKIAYLEGAVTLFGFSPAGAFKPPSGSFDMQAKDLIFKDMYALGDYAADGAYANVDPRSAYINTNGVMDWAYSKTRNEFNVRPSIMLKTEDIVFALSPLLSGTSTGATTVKEPELTSNYTSIYDATKNDNDMKARLLNMTMHAYITNLKDESNKALKTNNGFSQILESQPIKINGDANSVNGSSVSVLLFDTDGAFKYYIPAIGKANGSADYKLDTSGVPIGKYQLAIVNEVYDSNSAEPSYSSLISDVVNLEVLEGHRITYSKAPQAGATLGDYEYSKNVNAGDKVGQITYNGKGKPPIHYEIVGDGDNTYQNFEIIGLDHNGDSSATSLDVKIKGTGAPDIVGTSKSLKAGTYKFCIDSKDVDGDPSSATDNSKVCISLKVEKTQSTAAFTTTTQTAIKLGASPITESITTTNTDLKVGDLISSYALTGGTTGTGLNVSASTSTVTDYDISIGTSSSSLLPATFTLTLTTPETDNYLSATATKQIMVYNDLTALTWTPAKVSYSPSDVALGKVVGTLEAVGGYGPYTYELLKTTDPNYNTIDGADNGKFSIPTTSIPSGKQDVSTNTTLTVSDYHVQYKVEDSLGNTAYETAVIKVVANAQSVLDFKDKAGGTIITNKGKTIYFDDINEKLFAEGGSTGLSVVYDVAPQSMQPNGVSNASDYATISSNGLITPKKVGTIKVQAEMPGNANYNAVQTYMDLTIQPAKQSIAFTDTTAVKRVKKGSANFIEDAKGTLVSNNTNGIGGITYSSSDTNVATIDPNTGDITVGNVGTTTITAVLNDPTSASYDANYETKTVTKTITVYDGMSASWTATTPNLQADNTAIATASGGSVTVSQNNGAVSYAIASDTSIPENRDGALFDIVGSGTSVDVVLKQAISGNDIATHGGNTYKVQVVATDLDGPVTIDCTIIIEDADNDFYFTDASGSKITSITKVYGSNNNQFTLWTNTSNGKPVSYALEASANTGIVSVNNNAVTIQAVGTTTIEATVPAGSGFKAGTVTIPVTITPATQSIDFNNPQTSYVPFSAGTSTSEPATLTGNPTGSITFTSKTPSICSVVSPGTVTAIAQGTCTIEVSNSDANYTAVSKTKDVIFHVGATGAFTQSKIPQADNDATNGKNIGSVSVQGGVSGTTYTYSVSTSNDPKNANVSLFKVDANYGTLSLKQDIHASDIASATYDAVKKTYILKVQVDALDTTTNITTTIDCEVEIKGASLNTIAFDDGKGNPTTKITRVYAPNDSFSVNLLNNTGNGLPVYSLQTGSPIDVIDPTISQNTLDVLNANDTSTPNPPVIIEAYVPAKNGYEETTVSCEVEITKAPQDMFDFVNPSITMMPNSSITPTFKGAMTSGPITMTSSDTSIININQSDIESKSTESTATVTAINKGNRNYKDGIATATVNVSNTPAYPIVIQVPSATYGDTNVQGTIVSSGHTSGAVLAQTWTSSDPSIADIDNQGNITIYKAGQVTITCEQTSDKDPTVKASVTFTVNPKPITVTIDDKNKKVGETVPAFSATVDTTQLVGNDTIGQPNFICVDTAGNAVTNTSGPDVYPITGTYDPTTYPNYAITVIDGSLTVTQDASQNDWFYLEGVTSGNKLDPSKWHSEDVKVVLDTSKTGSYDEISLDQILWDPSYILVNTEDENQEDVYIKEASTSALATSQQTTIKIDKTKPEIRTIDGKPIAQNAISELLNDLTFGVFFKPKQAITVKAEDIIPTGTTNVSGITSIDYEVYELDKTTGLPISQTPYDTGTETMNANGEAKFSITDIGLYRVCATTSDQAGNTANTKCADLNIKQIDEDVDGDGEPDFNDSDGDNCPDLNIVLGTDKDGNKVKLNVAEKGKKYPYMNIDSNGDGKPDLNIDTDYDGKPDLNLVIMNESLWKPKTCVVVEKLKNYSKPIEYCTGTSAKPQINVVVDNGVDDIKDQVPSINIDYDGDMKANINISNDGKTAKINIVKLHDWKPNNDYTYKDFHYDSIGKDGIKIELNQDSDGDGYPDINLDTNGDGTPDLNIDTDYNGIPDLNIDANGDGKPDFNIDVSGNGFAEENIYKITEWKPNKDKCNIDGFEYDTMEIISKSEIEDKGIIIEKPDGSFLPNTLIKVNEISDSIDEKTKEQLDKIAKDQEVKKVYDVKYLENNTAKQPDGKVNVKIPIDPLIKNAKVVIEKEDGSFEEVSYTEKNGYYVFETEYIGKVSVIGDEEENTEPKPEPTPNPSTGDKDNPSTNVQGSYTNQANTSGIGGASTGDETRLIPYMGMAILSFFVIILIRKKRVN